MLPLVAGMNPCDLDVMQSRILVRPNLKLIVVGALAIAVLHHVVTSGKSEPSLLGNPEYRVSWLSDEQLGRLIETVEKHPTSDGYMVISEAYEKRGEIRKAMRYLKKANLIRDSEEAED